MTTLTSIAAELRTTEANALKRALLLKLTPVCDRCGGSGQYSFNQVDGTRCFGCNGVGHVQPAKADLPGVLEAARACVADGRLDHYLRGLEAARVAKTGRDAIFAAWTATEAAKALAGWGSHTLRDDQCPGNMVEVRAANAAMCDLYKAADEALSAIQFARQSDPDLTTKRIAAGEAVTAALTGIPAVDVAPDADLAEFVAERQARSAAARAARFG